MPAANDRQEGGNHYKQMKIEPWDFIAINNIGFMAGNVIRYVARADKKGGLEDWKKALHYCEKAIELEEQKMNTPNKP